MKRIIISLILMVSSLNNATYGAMANQNDAAKRNSTWGQTPRFFDPTEAVRRFKPRPSRLRAQHIPAPHQAAEPAAPIENPRAPEIPVVEERPLIPPLRANAIDPVAALPATDAASPEPGCHGTSLDEYQQMLRDGVMNTMGYGKKLYTLLSETIPADRCATLTPHSQTRLAFRGDGAKDGIIESRPCPICFETIIESPDHQNLMFFPCGHFFHEKCGKKWLERKRECPTCRKEVAIGTERTVKIHSSQPIQKLQDYIHNKIASLIQERLADLRDMYPLVSRGFRRLMLLCYLHNNILNEIFWDPQLEDVDVSKYISIPLKNYCHWVKEEAEYWLTHEERREEIIIEEQKILRENAELKSLIKRLGFRT